MKDSKGKLRSDIIANAMAYNNILTKEYLKPKPVRKLFLFTHPSERAEFSQRIEKLYGIKITAPSSDHE